MIRVASYKCNEVSALFNELVTKWKDYLAEEVSVEVNQSRGLLNNNLQVTIDFVFSDPLVPERKFIEYETLSDSLFPGTLRYFRSSKGKRDVDLFCCETINELKGVLLGLHFTSSYQELMLRYVS